LRCEAQTVYEDSAIVDYLKIVEGEDFTNAVAVCAFGGVKDEGVVGWGGVEVVHEFGVEGEGMGPAEVADDTNREVAVEELGGEGVVMADGCDSAEEIADGSPPETNVLGD
jgi:hypothetical protein